MFWWVFATVMASVLVGFMFGVVAGTYWESEMRREYDNRRQ